MSINIGHTLCIFSLTSKEVKIGLGIAGFNELNILSYTL